MTKRFVRQGFEYVLVNDTSKSCRNENVAVLDQYSTGIDRIRTMEAFDSTPFLNVIEQSIDIDAFAVLYGTRNVTYGYYFPTLFVDELSCPRSDIAETLK